MNDDDKKQRDLVHATAQESYAVASEASDGLNTPEHTQAIAAAVVDQLATKAATMAEAVITKPSAPAAQRVWDDMLDALEENELTPTIYCKRTGRIIGTINPEPWTDYLDAIASLGDTPQADTIRATLLSAIIAQKAYAVAPVVLTSSSANLAMIRETSPADFLAIAMEHLFPMPRGAQSTEIAQRAEQLGRARRLMSSIPHGSMQYACECVTLYLSYIRPHKLEANRNLLAKYGYAEQTDLTAPFLSVPTLGHFCGRIIQQMIDLIQQHRLRPVADLTQKDLLTLRVHWQGYPVFQTLRNARREWRAAQTHMSQNVPTIRGLNAARRTMNDLAVSSDHLDSFASAFLDTMDLSAAAQAGGHSLRVVLESDKQAQQAFAKHAELKAQQAKVREADETVELLDLSSLLVSGDLPIDMLPEVESAQDLVDAGLLDISDLTESGFSILEDDDEDDDDLEAALPSWLEAFQDEADKKTAAKRRHVTPKIDTPKEAAIHAAMSAMASGAMEHAHQQEQATKRLPMRGQGKSPIRTPAPKPAAQASNPVRRVIRK